MLGSFMKTSLSRPSSARNASLTLIGSSVVKSCILVTCCRIGSAFLVGLGMRGAMSTFLIAGWESSTYRFSRSMIDIGVFVGRVVGPYAVIMVVASQGITYLRITRWTFRSGFKRSMDR